MNNLNFFTNSYFHCEPQLSQHVDIGLTRNVCNSQSLPVTATNSNGQNGNIWSFSSTFYSSSLSSNGPSRLNNNGQSTTATSQPIYAWMKKKRGNAEGMKIEGITKYIDYMTIFLLICLRNITLNMFSVN